VRGARRSSVGAGATSGFVQVHKSASVHNQDIDKSMTVQESGFKEDHRSVRSVPRFRWWDYPVFAALTMLHLGVLSIILYLWVTGTQWGRTNPVFLLLLATVLLEFVIWEWRWIAMPLMRVPWPMAPRAGWRVGAAVTFVPGAEPIEMLEETLGGIVAIEYPHDTWVLDEGNEAAVQDLCRRLSVRYFSRKAMPQYQRDAGPFKARTKYGNYNAWLEEYGYGAYDLVVAFDSDHIPRPDYLHRVLSFFDDERVGYVQPAQAYYNQKASFIARAAAEETYAYYSSSQMTGYAVGYPIITGCHNVHRVTALRQIGGFPQHEADDLVMTLLYRAHGWRGVYLPRILARGLTPVDWTSYLKQQRRWARSVIDFEFRVFPRYAARLPLLERILTYVHGIYYLRGPIVMLQLLLVFFMLVTGVIPAGHGTWFLRYTAAIWATVLLCDFYRQRFFLDAKGEWGLHWRSGFVAFVKWPYFVLAFVDALRGKYGTYTITAKAGRSPYPLGFAATHAAVAAAVGTAWLFDYSRGMAEFIAVHIAAAFAVLTSLIAIVTAFWRYPAAYEDRLRRRWEERAEAGFATGMRTEPKR
jgi:cellulose synthase (UDP-forming)